MVFYQVCSNVGPRVQNGSKPGVPGLKHRNSLKSIKNLLLSNHMAQMLEICYIALPICFYLVCLNYGLMVQNGPTQGVLVLNHGDAQKVLKIFSSELLGSDA